VAFI